MSNFFKINILSIFALLISLISITISIKVYLRSKIDLKISSNSEDNFSIGFNLYKEYKLIILYLSISNNSTSAVDISQIRLVHSNKFYLASKIELADYYNSNGITLINSNSSEHMLFDITTDNILNNPRIQSYGTIHGFAVFENVNLIQHPQKFKLIVDTPSKSFRTLVTVNPCPDNFHPINPLKS
ncbi:hypothetical protein [Clostridium sp. BJN0013]|uniref:hypothetical protein n=1 Tax=Clostridium sp. BJN0013 TaxID=3236840 RepID=UPI0034C69C6D